MHTFTELAFRNSTFTLSVIKEAEQKIVNQLKTNGATIHVKNLQMLQLHRAVVAVGLFSMFDAWLQDWTNSSDGFASASKFLEENGFEKLSQEFGDYRNAINILKHGKGRSYEKLLSRIDELPFRIKAPDENFFDEGDVSEVETLIQVDDQFLYECTRIIEDVSNALAE